MKLLDYIFVVCLIIAIVGAIYRFIFCERSEAPKLPDEILDALGEKKEDV